MGEASKVSEEESLRQVDHVIRRVGNKLTVIVGANHSGHVPLVDFCKRVMDAGASGGMINPAQGLKTEEAVAGWFDGFVAALGGDIPIVLQDCPQLSGVFLSVETLNRLFVRHPSIKVLKHHEEGSAMQTLAAARR